MDNPKQVTDLEQFLVAYVVGAAYESISHSGYIGIGERAVFKTIQRTRNELIRAVAMDRAAEESR